MNFKTLNTLNREPFKTNGNMIKSNGIAAISSVQFLIKKCFLSSLSDNLVKKSIKRIIHKAVSKTIMLKYRFSPTSEINVSVIKIRSIIINIDKK